MSLIDFSGDVPAAWASVTAAVGVFGFKVSDEAAQRQTAEDREKLREDAAQYPDTMDQRYGAWAQLLTLSRLVHDGGGHAKFPI